MSLTSMDMSVLYGGCAAAAGEVNPSNSPNTYLLPYTCSLNISDEIPHVKNYIILFIE